MRRKLTIACNDLEILDIFLEHIYKLKILKKIIEKNDKSLPYCVIIITSTDKFNLEKIIKTKFNSQLVVR